MITMKGNNVTYTGKSWRKKTYWEDLDQEPPESPIFTHRPPRQYTSTYSPTPSYLPKDAHYYGMKKLKGGKGYDTYGHPQGIIGGPCPECTGTIINLQMNTSRKGMECTSEKVCDTCGLIIDGAFAIYRHKFEPYYIREPKEYHTHPFNTHQEWLERMKELENPMGNPDDIALDAEMFAHVSGNRMNDNQADGDEALGHYGHDFQIAGNNDRYTQQKQLYKQLGLKTQNPETSNRSSAETMQWKHKRQMDYVDICKTMLCMNKTQVQEVKYIIDTKGVAYFHRKLSYETIILTICICIMGMTLKDEHMDHLLDTMVHTYKIDMNTYYHIDELVYDIVHSS